MAIAAIGQICSTASMAHNLEQCVNLVAKAAAGGAKVLFLPEAADYIASSPAESLAFARPVAQSPFVQGLQAAAQQHHVAVHVGVHVPAPDAKLFNRTIWIDDQGRLDNHAAYDKLHLFDYAGANLRESAHTQAGTTLQPPYASPVGRVGSLICFDLRFPEVAIALGQGGKKEGTKTEGADKASPSTSTSTSPSTSPQAAQILVYPSAFTVATGRAHWDVLLRARAIESQCYVLAAAQVGRHNAKRVSYGHSLAVDPWGRVLCRLGGVQGGDDPAVDPATINASGGDPEDDAIGQLGLIDIDLDLWASIREKMPLTRRT